MQIKVCGPHSRVRLTPAAIRGRSMRRAMLQPMPQQPERHGRVAYVGSRRLQVDERRCLWEIPRDATEFAIAFLDLPESDALIGAPWHTVFERCNNSPTAFRSNSNWCEGQRRPNRRSLRRRANVDPSGIVVDVYGLRTRINNDHLSSVRRIQLPPAGRWRSTLRTGRACYVATCTKQSRSSSGW